MINVKSEYVTIDPKRMDHTHFESIEQGVKQAQIRVQCGWVQPQRKQRPDALKFADFCCPSNFYRFNRRCSFFLFLYICGYGYALFHVALYHVVRGDSSWVIESCHNKSKGLEDNVSYLRKIYQHDVSNMTLAVPCDESMMSRIQEQLSSKQVLRRSTSCPDSTWIEAFFGNEYDIGSDDHFVGISVGCNKGNDAVRTAMMGMSAPVFVESAWNDAIRAATHGINLAQYACPPDAKREEFKINSPTRGGEMHCIEPMPSNFALLKNASESLGLADVNFVVANAAVSSANGATLFPNARAGAERFGLGHCAQGGNHCVTVPLYTLDTYDENFISSKGPINVLSIDTEGWDFNVLFGAGAVLDRTHYLEFEAHEVGHWGKLHVTDAVRLLDSKGFTCYWAGRGNLWRITECYFDHYNDWRVWSNIACAHRSQDALHKIMEDTFQETIK